jgi:hypothetical protein
MSNCVSRERNCIIDLQNSSGLFITVTSPKGRPGTFILVSELLINLDAFSFVDKQPSYHPTWFFSSEQLSSSYISWPLSAPLHRYHGVPATRPNSQAPSPTIAVLSRYRGTTQIRILNHWLWNFFEFLPWCSRPTGVSCSTLAAQEKRPGAR